MSSKTPVAIVGLGCRFPSASGPDAFWDLLSEGTDAIRDLPESRRIDCDLPNDLQARGSFLDAIDQFDARAFKVSPREARQVDPQHRLLLEVTAEALADAGLTRAMLEGTTTAVYAGVMWNDYFRLQTSAPETLDGHSIPGGHLSFAANRISHVFDLQGPSMAIDAGCASSFVALHLACRDLRRGDADFAIVGGVNLNLAPDNFRALYAASLLAPSGKCRTLSADADGFVVGEGAGVVVLRRAEDTKRDRVYAYVRGTSVNHNGRGPWIMATDQARQEDLLRAAYRDADIDPAHVDVVELHGTASVQGDAREARALGAVVGNAKGRTAPCWVGSVKTNIGHLLSAAGMSQLFKLVLALEHETVPATLHLEQVNEEVPLDQLGLRVPIALEPLRKSSRSLFAAATSLSLGGTNAHIVLEGASSDAKTDTDSQRRHVLPLSVRTEDALRPSLERTLAWLERTTASVEDITYTAALRRNHESVRFAVTGASRTELASELRRVLKDTDTPAALLDAAQSRLAASNATAYAIGRAYMDGEAVDWGAVTADEAKPVSLPFPAWQRSRRWLKRAPKPDAVSAPARRADHGALAWTRRSLARHAETAIWETVVDVDLVSEDALLDAAVALYERHVGHRPEQIERYRVQTPLSNERGGRRTIQLSFVAEGDHGQMLDVSSRDDRVEGAAWERHLEAWLGSKARQ